MGRLMAYWTILSKTCSGNSTGREPVEQQQRKVNILFFSNLGRDCNRGSMDDKSTNWNRLAAESLDVGRIMISTRRKK